MWSCWALYHTRWGRGASPHSPTKHKYIKIYDTFSKIHITKWNSDNATFLKGNTFTAQNSSTVACHCPWRSILYSSSTSRKEVWAFWCVVTQESEKYLKNMGIDENILYVEIRYLFKVNIPKALLSKVDIHLGALSPSNCELASKCFNYFFPDCIHIFCLHKKYEFWTCKLKLHCQEERTLINVCVCIVWDATSQGTKQPALRWMAPVYTHTLSCSNNTLCHMVTFWVASWASLADLGVGAQGVC